MKRLLVPIVVHACAGGVVPAADSFLSVRIVGLAGTSGSLRIAVYGDEADFVSKANPIRRESIPIGGDRLDRTFVGLPPGEYAVSVHHDANGNGIVDKNPLGIPTEPYGFSNDARGTLGPPGWKESRVVLGPGENRIEIRVR